MFSETKQPPCQVSHPRPALRSGGRGLPGGYIPAAAPPPRRPGCLHFVSKARVYTRHRTGPGPLTPAHRATALGARGSRVLPEGASRAVFLGLAKCCVKGKGRQGG